MRSINKAIDILELFLNNKDEMTLGEIAEAAGLNKATTSHILKTLTKRGYLRQREKRGKYFLGWIFVEYSATVKSKLKLRSVAVPHLRKLSNLAKEAVILAIWDGNNAIITETIHPTNIRYSPLRVIPDEGVKSPLHCTGVGKIILAARSDEERQMYFASKMNGHFTPNTITNIEDMQKHLAQVSQDGIAYDDEEYSLGVRSVAAGLKDSDGNVIGAVGILSPSVRLTFTDMRNMSDLVKKCALHISKELGYKG
jgi:IclR family KDG regulon transcriptional repressor